MSGDISWQVTDGILTAVAILGAVFFIVAHFWWVLAIAALLYGLYQACRVVVRGFKERGTWWCPHVGQAGRFCAVCGQNINAGV